MDSGFARDLPVYVLLGGVVFFFIYVIIKGNQGEKAKKNEPPAGKAP